MRSSKAVYRICSVGIHREEGSLDNQERSGQSYYRIYLGIDYSAASSSSESFTIPHEFKNQNVFPP